MSLVFLGLYDNNRALYMVDTIVTHTAKDHPAESNIRVVLQNKNSKET